MTIIAPKEKISGRRCVDPTGCKGWTPFGLELRLLPDIAGSGPEKGADSRSVHTRYLRVGNAAWRRTDL